MQLPFSRPVQAFGALWQQVFSPAPNRSFHGLRTATLRMVAFFLRLTSIARSAIRQSRKNSGFSALAVILFAVGIGANTTVFLLLDSVLLKTPPYFEPANLLHITAREQAQPNLPGCLSYAHFNSLRQAGPTLPSIAGYAYDSLTLIGRGTPVRLDAARVSANFFSVLGVKPILGRMFRPTDDNDASTPSVLLSAHLWRRRFASDPQVIAQKANLDGRLYAVVGVLPENFHFDLLSAHTEVWAPGLTQVGSITPQQAQTGACFLNAIGRLAAASSLPGARAALAVRQHAFLHEYAGFGDANPKHALEVMPLTEKLTGNYRPLIFALSGTVLLFLLIACANIAGLSFARALDRRKEVALRIALGATRRHVITQLVSESLLLALCGGVVGLALSLATMHIFPGLFSSITPQLEEPGVGGWRALVFNLVLSALTGLLCGLAPAFQSADSNLSGILRSAGRGVVTSPACNLPRHILVTTQIAISVMFLVCAGLLAHSFTRLKNQSLGFNPNDVLSMNVALPQNRYHASPQITNFFSQLLERLVALPGIQSVALSSALPLDESRLSHVLAEGYPATPIAQRELAAVQSFTPTYLRTLRVPLIRGRFFTTADQRDSLPVAVINRAFAQRFFAGLDPIGKRVWLGKMPTPWQIVGLIGDVKNVSLTGMVQPELDIPFSQLPSPEMNLLVRSNNASPRLVEKIRAEIARQDPDQPATDVQTLVDLLAHARFQPRVLTTVLSIFAALAFLIAAAGVYSVISYQAARRKPEFGIRTALGATRAGLIGLVLGQAARVSIIGIAVGSLAALAVTHAAASLIYAVEKFDPLPFLVAPPLFFVVALLAALHPALRATRLCPADVLRTE